MQSYLKSFNPITAMKTRDINADTINVNTDDDLTLCVELIGKNQDKLAFNSIFRYFAPRLKSFLVKAGSTDSQAEEVIQDVMIAVWTKSSTYDSNKSSVSTWIYTIEINKRIDKIKERFQKIHPHIVIIPNKIHNNRKHLDEFVQYFDNLDVVIGPPIHDSSFIRKVYLKNYELERIERETIFNDLIKVMEFLNRYVMDEELDEIYRIDSKYERSKNLSIIK